jgi:transcriptional regulator with XRE-family HTH domain
MNNIVLKEIIHQKLKENGLSINAAEKLAGIGTSSLRHFLKGRTKNPDLETLSALASVLECDLSDLLGLNPKTLAETQEKEGSSNINKPVNYNLYVDVTGFVCDFLKDQKLSSISNEVFLQTLKKIYYFCLFQKNGVLDKEFASWYMNEIISHR